jgi:biopolymer transport protein TolR
MAMNLGGKNLTAQINVTPMIDVLLVLLIIFMMIPHNTSGLPSDVPQPPSPDSSPPPDPRQIVLEIAKDRSVRINSQPVEMADLAGKLAPLFARSGERILFLHGDGELEFSDVAAVIDLARGAGADRVALLTQRTWQP